MLSEITYATHKRTLNGYFTFIIIIIVVVIFLTNYYKQILFQFLAYNLKFRKSFHACNSQSTDKS
jgi:uncharacterized protein YybS (DUF2232 family)